MMARWLHTSASKIALRFVFCAPLKSTKQCVHFLDIFPPSDHAPRWNETSREKNKECSIRHTIYCSYFTLQRRKAFGETVSSELSTVFYASLPGQLINLFAKRTSNCRIMPTVTFKWRRSLILYINHFYVTVFFPSLDFSTRQIQYLVRPGS